MSYASSLVPAILGEREREREKERERERDHVVCLFACACYS